MVRQTAGWSLGSGSEGGGLCSVRDVRSVLSMGITLNLRVAAPHRVPWDFFYFLLPRGRDLDPKAEQYTEQIYIHHPNIYAVK